MISPAPLKQHRRNVHISTGAWIFRAVGFMLAPIGKIICAIDGPRKYNRMVRDIQHQMPWTISHLHPQITFPTERRLAMGRYASANLKCSHYSIWITADFYPEGYDFWADVGVPSNPASRIRIDVFAKQHSDLQAKDMSLRNFSDLDSLIQRLAGDLEKHFYAR